MMTPTDDQVQTLRASLDVFTRRYKLVDAKGAAKTLNEIDNQTLLYVCDHPACGPSDVARFLGVAATTISSATDRLVRRGLLKRHRPEGDRRAVALALSAEGQAHIAAYIRAHDELFRMMLARLSPGERETFVALMAKIAYHED